VNNVKRYALHCSTNLHETKLVTRPHGTWVKYEDYDRLLEFTNRYRERLEIVCMLMKDIDVDDTPALKTRLKRYLETMHSETEN